MKAHIVTRGFVGALAILACALILIATPNTSEAHGKSGNASSTKSSMQDVAKHAKKNLSNASSTSNVDATCMSEAVDVRESALIDAWSAFNANIVTALNQRKDALHAGWEITDLKERTTALVKAWKDWRMSKKDITADFRSARKDAWTTFKQTAKNECKMTTPKEESADKSASDSMSF